MTTASPSALPHRLAARAHARHPRSGGTSSSSGGRPRPTSRSRRTAGARSRGTRRRAASRRSRTPCSRAASAAATSSPCSPAHGSNGSSSTGPSCRSAPSSSASTRRTRRAECDVHPRPLRGGARVRRGRSAAREARVRACATPGAARDPPLRDLPELEAEGRAHAAEQPDALAAAAREIQEDDLGTLIYTSGTTGPPKGCMLTHKNLVTAALRVRTNIEDGSDTVLLFLPLAHTLRPSRAPGCGLLRRRPSRSSPTPRAWRRRSAPCARRSSPRCRASTRRSMRASSTGSRTRSGVKRALGRWALGVGARASAPAPLAADGAARPPRAGAPRRQARLRQGEGAPRRTASCRRLGRRAARRRRARVLPLARDARDRGLRPHRDGELAQRQRPGRIQVRHRRPRGRRLRDQARRATARSSSAATPSSPATTRIRRRLPPRSPTTAGSAPATSARSTRTAT